MICVLNIQMFGGRGAYSNLPGNSSSAQWSNGNLTIPIHGMRETLGIRGKPMSIGDAVAANPYYHPDFKEYSENCQRCVVAYELRRRGYDVIARETFDGDDLPDSVYGTDNGRWQGAFKHVKVEKINGYINGISNTPMNSVIQEIQNKLNKAGPNSRAVIVVKYKNGRTGHVFNVENINGKMQFVDAQTNKIYSSNVKFKYDFLKTVDLSYVRFIRTDNLQISGRVVKFVRKNDR